MKQLQFFTGGRPVNNDDFTTLQQELTDAVQAQFVGRGPFIVAGCEVSGPATGATITAGIVFLDGQLLRYAGQSGATLPAQLQAGSTVGSDPRPYQTGGTKDCMKEVPALLGPIDPSYSGEVVVVDTWGGKRWDHVVKALGRTLYETQTLGTRAYNAAHYDATGLGLPGTEAWGWALANGLNDTDNLGEKFLVGGNPAYQEYQSGAIGGAVQTRLTTANLPANPVGTGDVLTYVQGGGSTNVAAGSGGNWTGRQPVSGSSDPIDNRPPYVALMMRQWVGYQ